MCCRQISDVNKISNTCPVWCIEIVAEHSEGWRNAQNSLQREGNQVGLRIVNLTDRTVRMCTRGIEVTKRNIAENVGNAICVQYASNEQLC